MPHLQIHIEAPVLAQIQRTFRDQNNIDDKMPMLMEYKQGNNLSSVFKSGRFAGLPLEERNQLFRSIGEVAGYDFFIANFDRFVGCNRHAASDTPHKANGGNIMIEFTVPNTLKQEASSLSIRTIHVIDTAPYPDGFFEPSETREVVEEVCLGGSLWDEEEDETSPVESTSSDETTSLISGPARRDLRHRDFCEFMQGDAQFIQELAEHIFDGLVQEHKRCSPESQMVHSNEEQKMHNEALAEGLISAREHIRSCVTEHLLLELQQIEITSKAGQIVLDFMQRNVEFLKSMNK